MTNHPTIQLSKINYLNIQIQGNTTGLGGITSEQK
jgi:hypothetical protein